MLFNSFAFAAFFPLVTLAYFLLPHRARWVLLLAASCYFYMAFIPVYILILGFTIAIDYAAGILIENAEGAQRKRWLVMSLAANIGVLAVFKYFNFVNTNIAEITRTFDLHYPIRNLGMLLPIGLSFHTFQAMSYTIEVYRGHQKAERHFGIYALYVMFYPQLVAGPIERPQNLLPQFHKEHSFDYARVTDGLKLMFWGLFKKVVIADRLAAIVNPIYDNPHGHAGLALLIATYLFAFQIYCDFSGYSDIAIGAAQVMGFRLMDNFNRPYFSKSISEFWKRWHISLSTWFRDYLYIPLGGNRVAVPRWYLNLFVVFVVSGLWHGANWTFLIWGALHGMYLIFGQMAGTMRKRIWQRLGIERRYGFRKYVEIFITFNLVSFAWIFFRAHSVTDAFYIISHLFDGVSSQLARLDFGVDRFELVLGVCAIVFMEAVHLMQRHREMRRFLSAKPWFYRWTVYYAMAVLFLLFSKTEEVKFIYFQF